MQMASSNTRKIFADLCGEFSDKACRMLEYVYCVTSASHCGLFPIAANRILRFFTLSMLYSILQNKARNTIFTFFHFLR